MHMLPRLSLVAERLSWKVGPLGSPKTEYESKKVVVCEIILKNACEVMNLIWLGTHEFISHAVIQYLPCARHCAVPGNINSSCP